MHKNLSVYLSTRYGPHSACHNSFNMTDFIFNVNFTLKVNMNKNVVDKYYHNTFIVQKKSKKKIYIIKEHFN